MNTLSAPPRSRASRRVRALIALVVVAMLAGAGYYVWRTWVSPSAARDAFLTAAVQRGDLEDTVTATGTLQPRDYVDVGTQVSGQLKKLHVAIGAVVKESALLAEIDPTVYVTRVDAGQAQLRNLRAQLADKESQLVLAQQQLARQQSMMRDNATTAEALQTAEAALRSVAAQIESVKAQIQQTESTLRGDEASLGYTRIYAPMSGTVVSQAAKQGQTLNANQQAPIVMRIADLSVMTVQSQVSEADVSRLRLGMDVYFTTLGGGEKRWYGKLRQVLPTPEVINNVVLYNALFDVPNPDQALKTQMTAQVFFVIAAVRDAIQVPVAALRPAGAEGRRRGKGGEGRHPEKSGAAGDAAPGAAGAARAGGAGQAVVTGDPRSLYADGKAVVRVVNAEGKAEDRTIRVGVMNRVSAEVVAGLEPGERVVIGARPASTPARPQPGGSTTPRFQPRI